MALADSPSVDFSPDDRFLLSGGADGKLRIWNVEYGQVRAEFAAGGDWTYAARFSRDGKWIYSTGTSHLLSAWKLTAESTRARLGIDQEVVLDLAGNHESQEVVTTSAKGFVRAWDLSSGMHRNLVQHNQPMMRACISPDRKLLAGVDAAQAVRVWSFSTGKLLHSFADPSKKRARSRSQSVVAIDPQNRFLVVGTAAGNVRIWSLRDSRLLVDRLAHESGVTAVSIDAKGKLLAIASKDGRISLWDLRSDVKAPRKWLASSAKNPLIQFVDQGATLLIVSGRGVRRYALAANQFVEEDLAFPQDIESLAVSGSSRLLAVGTVRGRVVVRRLDDGQLVSDFVAGYSPVMDIVFSADDLITTLTNRGVALVHRLDGKAMKSTPAIAEVSPLEFDYFWEDNRGNALLYDRQWYAAAVHFQRLLRHEPKNDYHFSRLNRAWTRAGYPSRAGQFRRAVSAAQP